MIIYFSGTGNTRYVALELAKLLDESVHELSPNELSNPSSTIIDIHDERIIWAFPTYSWGIPPVVANYIKKVQLGASTKAATHFMVTTCGDDMGYTDKQWRHILHARGLNTAGAFAIIMPNTYTLMKGFDVDSPDLAKTKLSNAALRIEKVATAISATPEEDMPIRGKYPWIKSNIIYPWFKIFAMSPKPFHSTDKCIGCGKCALQCPMANITMTDNRPMWSKNCALCLRCYHICPKHAVHYGNETKSKGQYLCPKTSKK